ncbi:MAG: PilW family protein [Gemmatimonadota bacterium]
MFTRPSSRVGSRRHAVAALRGADEGGFTLVELMLVLVIFSAIGIAATRFLLTQTAFFNRQTDMLGVRQNTRAALHRLSSDIRLVGRGLNNYDLEVPDLIVPNDGSVSVNTFTDGTISLLSIPDPAVPGVQLSLNAAVPQNGDVGSTDVAVEAGWDPSSLAAGSRLILFDPNSGNSQVVTLTAIVADTLVFANDTLVFDFPTTGSNPTRVLLLNEVRYRVNRNGDVPFLERRVDDGGWVRFVEGITDLRFSYFDESQDAFAASPAPFFPSTPQERRAIKWIRVSVTGEAVRIGRNSSRPRVTLETDVVPRNMIAAP